MKGFVHRISFALAAFLVVAMISLSGCTDSLTGYDEAEPARVVNEVSSRTPTEKFRHANLLDRAVKPGSSTEAGKTGSGNDVLRIIFALEPQRVFERYKVLNRYKVLHRYEYDKVFDGFAITVMDSLGLNDFDEFIELLLNDPDILWFEPDITVINKPKAVNSKTGNNDQMLPWGVDRIGAYKRKVKDVKQVNLFVMDTGVETGDIDHKEQIDFTSGSKDKIDTDGHGTQQRLRSTATRNLPDCG